MGTSLTDKTANQLADNIKLKPWPMDYLINWLQHGTDSNLGLDQLLFLFSDENILIWFTDITTNQLANNIKIKTLVAGLPRQLTKAYDRR